MLDCVDMQETTLLTNLNDEQKTAVTHTSGPLLIVAGAGTGKTTVITRRIAWLIEQKLAKSQEILALTFTEKAAGEMEGRVDQLVRYGDTNATIATFHAFGDQLLREYSLDLDLPPEFRVLGSDEQEIFLTERLDLVEDLTELRPTNNPEKYIRHILRVISRAKDELVSPERYAQVADELMAAAKDDEEKRAAGRQTDIAKIYTAYEEFKAQEGVIDFGDQILKLVNFLDREPTVRRRLQDRYRYVLVDEFQDTNIAQYELVRRILGPENNLTVVGDDDQAIYKFRGAAVANILTFLKDFPKSTQVVLRHNYRSTQTILDAAHQLIQANNPDRLEVSLGIDKRLIGTGGGQNPNFAWYAHDVDELDALVAEIRDAAKTTPLNRIAVLVRTNALLDPIAASLKRAEIAYTVSSDYGFHKKPEVQGITAFFRSLVHPDDSLSLMKLAFSPYYELKPDWILILNDAAKKEKSEISDILHHEQGQAWQRLPEEGRGAVRALREDLSRYRTLIGKKSPGEILYQFLRERGILRVTGDKSLETGPADQIQPSLFESQPEEQQHTIIQNIAAVFEAIKRYESAGRDPFVPRFVDQLDDLLSRVVPPAVDLGPDITAVQLLTVHAAKGLEFELVFLPYFTQDRFPARRKHEPLSLPNELISEILPTGDEHEEEERRLAYVALTRAKHKLYLSGAAKSGDGLRTKKPSQFILETLGITKVPEPIARIAPAARIHLFAPITVPAPIKLNLPSYDGLYFLSPAMIETYHTDPYQFYWRYVLKAPQPASRQLNYGNAIHAAIEAYHRLRIAGKKPKLDDLLKRYQEAWVGEGYRTKKDEADQYAHGKDTLAKFFLRAEQGSAPSHIEETVTLLVPGARIRGRIDAVYADRGEIRDFKTSDIKDQKDADKKIKENIPITIYALAYQKQFGKLPDRLVLDYVEKGIEAVRVPDVTMIAKTNDIISEAIAGIRAGEFSPNPSNQFKDYD